MFCAARLAGAGTLYEVEENPSGRALMRLFIVGAALLFSVSTTAAAQSRWTFSAGPEWSGVGNNSHIYGGRLRAQYDLLRPDRPLRLHLEFGGRWEPTQSYFNTLSDGSNFGGVNQSVDLTFGLGVAVAPLPRARFAPYVTFAMLARQRWWQGSYWFQNLNGSYAWNAPQHSSTRGDIIAALGLGTRVRLGGRMFQLEMRQIYGSNSVLLGTNLPF